jgi:hypothetical protein
MVIAKFAIVVFTFCRAAYALHVGKSDLDEELKIEQFAPPKRDVCGGLLSRTARRFAFHKNFDKAFKKEAQELSEEATTWLKWYISMPVDVNAIKQLMCDHNAKMLQARFTDFTTSCKNYETNTKFVQAGTGNVNDKYEIGKVVSTYTAVVQLGYELNRAWQDLNYKAYRVFRHSTAYEEQGLEGFCTVDLADLEESMVPEEEDESQVMVPEEEKDQREIAFTDWDGMPSLDSSQGLNDIYPPEDCARWKTKCDDAWTMQVCSKTCEDQMTTEQKNKAVAKLQARAQEMADAEQGLRDNYDEEECRDWMEAGLCDGWYLKACAKMCSSEHAKEMRKQRSAAPPDANSLPQPPSTMLSPPKSDQPEESQIAYVPGKKRRSVYSMA